MGHILRISQTDGSLHTKPFSDAGEDEYKARLQLVLLPCLFSMGKASYSSRNTDVISFDAGGLSACILNSYRHHWLIAVQKHGHSNDHQTVRIGACQPPGSGLIC